MKKLFLTLVAVSALSFSSFSQGEKKGKANSEQAKLTPEQRADKETKNATAKLVLTADQQSKFKVYALDRARSNSGLREKAKASTVKEEKQKYRGEIKANNEKYFTNVNSILTAEQQVKWAEHKKKVEEKEKNQIDE